MCISRWPVLSCPAFTLCSLKSKSYPHSRESSAFHLVTKHGDRMMRSY